MQARYYDPVMGRFLSVDPVGYSGATDTGMFGRYTYVGNDPVNATDPFGECSTDKDGNQVGVCGTDKPSQDLLDETKKNSPETTEADAFAESAGINIPFTYDPNGTGGGVDGGVTCEPCSVTVSGNSQAIDAVDTRTGETIPYANSPQELTAHEVGGHVRDRLLGQRQEGNRDQFTPNAEVNAIKAENNFRAATGNPVRRNNYNKTPPLIVVARRGGGPSSQLIYNATNLPPTK
jgi:uncharacterized protein RhaS with RHS repeats